MSTATAVEINACHSMLSKRVLLVGHIAAGIDSAQAWIDDRVFESFADSPAGQIVELAELLTPVAPGFVVSDDAVADGAVRPSKAEWARFVDACNSLRATRAESA